MNKIDENSYILVEDIPSASYFKISFVGFIDIGVLSNAFLYKKKDWFFLRKANPNVPIYRNLLEYDRKQTPEEKRYNAQHKIIVRYLPIGLFRTFANLCKTLKLRVSYNKDKITSHFVNPFYNRELLSERLNAPFGENNEKQARDYQVDATLKLLEAKRGLVLSPTASGKSFLIYHTSNYLVENGKNVVLFVITKSLAEQLRKDFISYGCDESLIKCMYSGQTKKKKEANMDTARIWIMTWQTAYSNCKKDKDYMKNYDALIFDEVHSTQAPAIEYVLRCMRECYYRYGFTGTLHNTALERNIVLGCFGRVIEASNIKELTDRGMLAKIHVNCVKLVHDNDMEILNSKTGEGFSSPIYVRNVRTQEELRNIGYRNEMVTIQNNDKRNSYIAELVGAVLKKTADRGVSLVLFREISHGRLIEEKIEMAKSAGLINKDMPVAFLYGDTDVEERERVREEFDGDNKGIILASYGIFSTGVNIVNIQSIIMASSYKNKIKIMQSIGRGMRVGVNNETVQIYDICDSFDNRIGTTLSQAKKRKEYYEENEISYTEEVINLSKGLI